MFVRATLAAALVAAVGLGPPVRAVEKNPCPPIIPKVDVMEVMSNPALTQAEKMHRIARSRRRVVDEPATWSGCHTIRDTLKIKAPVGVAPGAVLRFKADAGLKIERNGSLNAAGTADQPITFTAVDETPGYWYGLYFDSRSRQNRLIHARVLYAGGRTVGVRGRTLERAGGDNNPPSRAILVREDALLSVEHSRVAYSGGYGVEVLGALGTFADNRIAHTRVPMRLQLDAVGHIDASNRFVGNARQQIDVIGNDTVTRDATWEDPGIPYNVRFFVSIAADLELEPGVTLRMGDGADLVIEQGASLRAAGTTGNPIVIRGWSERPGYWGELVFQSQSKKSVLRYVRIADGGGAAPYNAIISVLGYLKVENSWIANSPDIGILVGSSPIRVGDFHDFTPAG